MKRRTLLMSAPLAALVGFSTSTAFAQAADVAGIKFPAELDLRGTKLTLNGAGMRTRLFVKVYAAGLYVPKKSSSAAELATMAGPKRMHLHFVRDTDADQFGTAFTRGFSDNVTKDEFSKLVGSFSRMGQIFADKKRVAVGETISVDFYPGVGTQILINGKPAGDPFKEPEFYPAMLKVWLGERPVDTALKPLLLGDKPIQAAPRTMENS
jgi:hypothetical protein